MSEESEVPRWIGRLLGASFFVSFPALLWWKALGMQADGGTPITKYGAPVSPNMLWFVAALFAVVGLWGTIKVFTNPKIESRIEAFTVSGFIAIFCFGSCAAVVVSAQAQSELIEEARQ